jgi:hypothetical protein
MRVTCHPERSVLSKRSFQLAKNGVSGKPDFGLLGWEEDPRDLLLLQLGWAEESIPARVIGNWQLTTGY